MTRYTLIDDAHNILDESNDKNEMVDKCKNMNGHATVIDDRRNIIFENDGDDNTLTVNVSKDYAGKLSENLLGKIMRYSTKRETLLENQTDTGFLTLYRYTYANGVEFFIMMVDGEIVHAAGF